MKWFLIIVLIFVVMLIARAVSEQYKEKYDFYSNLKTFLQQFKINVSFRQEKINDFLNNVKAKKQFNMFIEAYKEYLKKDEINFKEIKVLDIEEKNQLETIIRNIGKFNAENEISQLEAFLVEIDEKLIKAEADKNKLCPMILKLSLLFAVGLAILLI
ncbi:MAG: hypothetical protein IJW36_02890 [Clostridia bacterium]|nr:hypothetical protein [Clostridia bacterium]